MKIEGQFVFDGARREVWDLLLDPEVLRATVPGVQQWREVAPHEYEATLKVGIAAVSGTFTGKLAARDLQPPDRYTLEMEGSGGPGFVRGRGEVSLLEQDTKTVMRYVGEVQLGGMLAGVGQRMLSGIVKMLVDQALSSMARQLGGRLAERRRSQAT